MTYKGHVKDGVIIADDPMNLPEGTVVEFRPLSMPDERHHPDVDRYRGILKDVEIGDDEYYQHVWQKHS
ncbi:MAG: hypothetical protein HYV26_04480 [Candidatus Hydrogenedentes bacterium]|nr:hypothetical protein [Candidatus Hydrogenedentota bacterium]